MEEQTSNYVVLHAENLIDLIEMVCDFMSLGFIPCGGAAWDKQSKAYLQALYKPLYVTTGAWAVTPVITTPYTITYTEK